MVSLNNEIYNKIFRLWKETGIKNSWGDNLDVRFYLARLLQEKYFNILLDISSNYGIILSGTNAGMRVGLEYSWEYLIKSKEHFPTLKNICASSEFLPFKDNSIDAIVLAHSLPEWGYPLTSYKNKNGEVCRKDLFRQMHRILKPNGKLFITVVNGEHVYYKDKSKPVLDKVISYTQNLFYIEEIMGWNPLPVVANIVPYALFKRTPFYIKKIMFLPSIKMYLFVPGIWRILLFLSKMKALNKYCRHFLIICCKN
ncbi:MAG: class I SAM-dependent methyltransferase [Candidatus Omnitrophica bacterium]|nr:class I SAM-dependent methyltransferase [Candidatus Omnitrophota bacterium]